MMRLAETAETGEDRRALPSRAGFRCPRKDPMRRTEVTIEEHHSGNVTERVASLVTAGLSAAFVNTNALALTRVTPESATIRL